MRVVIDDLRRHRDTLAHQPIVTGALVIDQMVGSRTDLIGKGVETAHALAVSDEVEDRQVGIVVDQDHADAASFRFIGQCRGVGGEHGNLGVRS